MQAYNVETFDRNMEPKSHTTVGAVNYKQDYLTLPDTTVITAGTFSADGGDYVRLQNPDAEIFGILQTPIDTQVVGEYQFKDFLSIFDTNILFDTSQQGGGTALEEVLAQYITQGWISNTDASQNVPGLSVSTISSTTSWNFYIKPDKEGTDRAIVNFQRVLMQRALTEHNIGVYVTPNFRSKTITLRVGVLQAEPVIIEADLPSILEKTIIVDQKAKSVNKAVLYNKSDMMTSVTYYLHPDGSFDTNDTNRILPAVYQMQAIEAENFLTAAAAEAGRIFTTENKNFAELRVLNDDPIAGMQIGQQAHIMTGGQVIQATLTGKETGDTTTLTFGTIRLDLTKILRLGRT